MIDRILASLNDRQRAAVSITDGPVLVLAGAGSGKTRMLTARIAKLIEQDHVAPWNILAVTFTNKAAREMRDRLESFTSGGQYVWCSTFHSLCVRILRSEATHIGFERNFSIYDEEDSLRVLKACLTRAKLNETTYPAKYVRACISSAKDKMVPPGEYASLHKDDFRSEKIGEVYLQYQKDLKASNAMDFDDLIMNTLRLFQEHQDILTAYAMRFRYIHVDEYQDTSQAQYMLIRLLSCIHHNICVVGDDDQSIYGWRGADIRNILDFEKDFPGAQVIRLEQNYRSTQTILDAANAVIANNTQRKPKKLWTENEPGAQVVSCSFSDANQEADFIASEINSLVLDNGHSYNEIAVFYRTHAQSRLLGQSLVRNGIPYQVVGGVGFWQRKEIKDAVAYLKLLVNPDDSVSLHRIINTPKRGIGDSAVETLDRYAAENEESILSAALHYASDPGANARIKKNVQRFAELFSELSVLHEMVSVSELVQQTLEKSGLLSMYDPDVDEDAQRIENLLELVTAAKQFEAEWSMGIRTYTDEEIASDTAADTAPVLADWLMSVSLESDISDGETPDTGAVTLMTIHGAKGLEFPIVFLTGLEEGVFPHVRSIGSDDELQEERRLCYVGITRAKELLYLTHAEFRALMNNASVRLPSRFLREIPLECVENRISHTQDRSYSFDAEEEFGFRRGSTSYIGSGWQSAQPRTSYSSGFSSTATAGSRNRGYTGFGFTTEKQKPKTDTERFDIEFVPGDHVLHKVFGKGVVISAKGDIVTVAFDGRGVKQLSVTMAKLQKT